MVKFKSYFLVLGFMLSSACTITPTEDIQIEAHSDPKANFNGYKSYAWLGTAGIINDPQGKWKKPKFDIDNQLRFLVNRELRNRGLSENSNNPDMLVAYAMGVNMAALKIKENTNTNAKMLKNVPEGSLVVMLIDPETRFVVWTGAARAEVHQYPDNEVVKNRLDYAVTKMIEKLPR